MVAERINRYSLHIEAFLDDVNVSVGKFLLHEHYLDIFFLSLADYVFKLCSRRFSAFLLNGYLHKAIVTCKVCKGRMLDNESLGFVAGSVSSHSGVYRS